MTITRQNVLDAEKKASDARREMVEMRRQFAYQECPLKVGDITETVGWTHKGKRMRVTHITAGRYSFDGDWVAHGAVLKKDGSEGRLAANFSQNDWEAEKAKEKGK